MFRILIVIGLSLSMSASAFQWEVGAGKSFASAQGDGVWYQQAFPHALDLREAAFKVGITGEVNRHLRWHLDAVHLGRFSSDGMATPHDDNYSPSSANGCNGACLPLVRFTGSGTVGGLAATLEAHTRGPWKLGVEAGPFLYRSSWKMRVPGWYPSQQSKSGHFEAVASPRNLDFGAAEWKVGGVVGLTFGRGPWTLSMRRYLSGASLEMGEGEWTPIWRSHTVLMVNRRFD